MASKSSSLGDRRALPIAVVRRALDAAALAHPLPAELLDAVAQSFLAPTDGSARFGVRRRQLGAISVVTLSMSEMTILRLPFSRSNTVHLGFVLEGSISIAPRGGQTASVAVGEVVVITNWASFDVSCVDNTTVLNVLIPEARLRERGVRVRPARIRLDGVRTLFPPVLAFAEAVDDIGWHPSATARRIAGRALEDLCVGLLIEWDDANLDRGDLRGQLRRRAIDEISLRHRDPLLSPRALAKALGVSLRHLQRGFEGSGTTVAEQIATYRTESAALLLTAPGASGLTVSEVARAAGFGSPYELRSAFRQRFALSPSEYRALRYEDAPRGGEYRANGAPSGADPAIVVS